MNLLEQHSVIEEALKPNSPIILILRAIILLVPLFSFVKKMIQSNMSLKRRKNSKDFISEVLTLDLPSSLKEIYEEERNRTLFYKIKGFDLSTHNQLLLYKFHLKLNDRFSWTEFKIARKFFRFSEEQVVIDLAREKQSTVNFNLFLSIVLIVCGFVLDIALAFAGHILPLNDILSNFILGLFLMLYGFVGIRYFVTPFNVAKRIIKATNVPVDRSV